VTALITVLVKLLCDEPLRPRCFVPCICFVLLWFCALHALHLSPLDRSWCADCGSHIARVTPRPLLACQLWVVHYMCRHATTVGVPTVVLLTLTTVGVLTVVQRSWHGPKMWPQLAWPVVAMHLQLWLCIWWVLTCVTLLVPQTQVRVFFGRIGQTGTVSDFGAATHCDTA